MHRVQIFNLLEVRLLLNKVTEPKFILEGNLNLMKTRFAKGSVPKFEPDED